ncbi:SUMF1/EgtB/PvdO family nonheme iron enzyme [Chloroflexi bacterium TSY]|nr:SUMF1/EgtB/PvdO family nonheme iron enzyme [Chloroflexi bacterium TSY]
MFIGCLVIPILVVIALGVVAFRAWSNASAELTVPAADVLLVRNAPQESAPLIARFGAGQTLSITGRSEDWRWLEVEIWDGQHGWALRPLDILVWQLRAEPTTPRLERSTPEQLTSVEESMVSIPGGPFTMGSPPGLGQEDESPAHAVTLSPFAIDRTEVTVGQYWQCVEAGECTASTNNASQTEPHYLNDPRFDNHPAIHIPWSEAKAYCTWRGKRLPTEAEWEMAAGWDARRNAKALWPWGNNSAAARVNVNAYLPDTATVGTFADDSSPAGVLDMGGNVREWVLDWYKVDYYSVADDTDPTGPSNRRGEGAGRVVRGASFANTAEQARTANRSHEDPAYGYATVGFRCAQDQ